MADPHQSERIGRDPRNWQMAAAGGGEYDFACEGMFARRATMSLSMSRTKLAACSILAGLMASVPGASTIAQGREAPPDFSSNLAGWVGLNGGGPYFEADPGRQPGPVVSDPDHPFVPNGVGAQPTFRIADLSNPNLMPWAKEVMKKDIDDVLAEIGRA